jgi:predicted nucleic acid-binding protein
VRTVFADNAYWIALLNPRDQLHAKAKAVSAAIHPVRTFTSDMVLTELLNYFAKWGPTLRKATTDLVARLRQDPNVTVVPQTSLQFQEALAYYSQREDKSWSHTDCASLRIMEAEGIREALTYDQHFEQAGFVALLRG